MPGHRRPTAGATAAAALLGLMAAPGALAAQFTDCEPRNGPAAYESDDYRGWDIAVGPGGRAAFTWTRKGRLQAHATYVAVRSGRGRRFSDGVLVSRRGVGSSGPRVAVDGRGAVTAAWIASPRGAAPRIVVATLPPGARRWSRPATVASGRAVWIADLAADGAGRTILAWGGPGGRLRASVRSSAAGRWRTSTLGAVGTWAMLAASPGRGAALVWPAPGGALNLSRLGAGPAFGRAEPLPGGEAGGRAVGLAMNRAGALAVSWAAPARIAGGRVGFLGGVAAAPRAGSRLVRVTPPPRPAPPSDLLLWWGPEAGEPPNVPSTAITPAVGIDRRGEITLFFIDGTAVVRADGSVVQPFTRVAVPDGLVRSVNWGVGVAEDAASVGWVEGGRGVEGARGYATLRARSGGFGPYAPTTGGGRQGLTMRVRMAPTGDAVQGAEDAGDGGVYVSCLAPG